MTQQNEQNSAEQVKRKRGRPKKESVIIKNSSDLPNEAVTDIVKQKKKQVRPNRSESLKVHAEPNEMSRMITNSVGLRNIGKEQIDMKDPKQIDRRIDIFLEYCIERGMKPTVESMALAFGTDRVTLWKMKEGQAKDLPTDCRASLKRGYDLMNELMTQIMSEGKINPVSAIFLLKNNHAYRDQTEVVVTPQNPYADGNPDDVRNKYLEGVPDEVNAEGTVE